MSPTIEDLGGNLQTNVNDLDFVDDIALIVRKKPNYK